MENLVNLLTKPSSYRQGRRSQPSRQNIPLLRFELIWCRCRHTLTQSGRPNPVGLVHVCQNRSGAGQVQMFGKAEGWMRSTGLICLVGQRMDALTRQSAIPAADHRYVPDLDMARETPPLVFFLFTPSDVPSRNPDLVPSHILTCTGPRSPQPWCDAGESTSAGPNAAS